MASAQTVDKLFTNHKITVYDHDPDSTAATAVEWVDMRDYKNFAAIAFASALTGTGVTAFSIVADSDSDGGSGNNVTVVSHAVGSAPDAVGDYLVLECTAEQIGALGDDNGYDLRYVSAKLTMNNAGDENVVVYIRSGPRFAYDGLTADTVA